MRARGDGAFADEEPEDGDGGEAGKQGPEKNLAVSMVGDLQEPQRSERAGDGADRVHQAFEPEGAAICVGRDVGGEESFFCRGADAAAEPSRNAGDEYVISVSGEGERGGRESGESVAKDGQRLSIFQAIGVVAGGKFCEAGEAVGDTFDGAEPDRTSADGGEEGGEDRGGGFMAPVAKEAGEADAQDSAVEPGLFFWAVVHVKAVYS